MYAYLIDKKTCVVSLIYTCSEGAIIEGWETLHETENGGEEDTVEIHSGTFHHVNVSTVQSESVWYMTSLALYAVQQSKCNQFT